MRQNLQISTILLKSVIYINLNQSIVKIKCKEIKDLSANSANALVALVKIDHLLFKRIHRKNQFHSAKLRSTSECTRKQRLNLIVLRER